MIFDPKWFFLINKIETENYWYLLDLFEGRIVLSGIKKCIATKSVYITIMYQVTPGEFRAWYKKRNEMKDHWKYVFETRNGLTSKLYYYVMLYGKYQTLSTLSFVRFFRSAFLTSWWNTCVECVTYILRQTSYKK